jgi:hypothetical protein
MGIDIDSWLGGSNDDTDDSSSSFSGIWNSLLGGGDDSTDSSNSDDDSSSDNSDDTTDTPSNSDEWWYGNPPPLKWPKPEVVRMAPMQNADEAETIAVRVFHNGNVNSAKVSRVYIEAMLRDAWGSEYHIDVSIRNEPVRDVTSNNDWWAWVDNHEDETVKDCNVFVPNGGGWGPSAAADTAIAFRGHDIDDLYGETLYVVGDSKAHDNLSTVLHEVLHCLGFDHCDGGTRNGGVTPMGHYCSSRDSYSAYVHPDVAAMTPVVQ